MQLYNHFKTIKAARKAIKRYVLNNGESFKVDLSNKKWYSIICKERGCRFGIQAFKLSKEVVFITIFKLYTCSPAVYYDNRQAHSVSYLIEHYRMSIINNRKITIAQIRSNERLLFNNEISYIPAYCTIQAVLTKMYSDEAESFAKFPAFVEQF
jgi:hypothetical protein